MLGFFQSRFKMLWRRNASPSLPHCSEQMARIPISRTHHVKDVMMQAARSTGNYCLDHPLGKIVVG